MSMLQAMERPSLADLPVVDAGSLSSVALRTHSSTEAPAPSPALLKRVSSTPGLMLYTVSHSDSFPGIAVRFNTTPSVLQRLNRLPNQSIFPGQNLAVPDPSYTVSSPADHNCVSASRASSGISCGSNATLGVDPLSRLCSAGQVTSAQSTASDQGVSFRGHPAAGGEGGKQSSAMVKNEHASSGCLSDEYVVISGDHYSQERSDGDVRERRKTDQQTGSGSDKRKSASLPTNSEPLPLQVVTESLLAIDAQLADLEEGIVRGTLRITKERLSFVPWGADRLVKARGIDVFLRNMQMSAVTSVSMYPDLVKMSLMDVPLVMRRNGGGTADFSFVSSKAWSCLAPRVHCMKATPSALSPTMPSSSGTSLGAPPVLASASKSSSASTPPILRLRSATSLNTPPTSRVGSGSRSGVSPTSIGSPFRQRHSALDANNTRSPAKKLSLFRQRSASVEVDDGSKWVMQHLQLPGYLNIRTEPLDQERSDASEHLTFVVSGTQKELLFDFFSHNVPHVQQADFSDLVVLFANLQAESSGLEVAGDSGVAQLGEMMGGTHTGLQRGQAMALRTLSPSPDESPQHVVQRERSSSFTGGTGAARSSVVDDNWELVSPEQCCSPKAQRSISLPETPSLETKSNILSDAQLTQLSNKLPLPLLGHTWKLAYSTYVSGISLKTLYRNCLKATEGPVLLVVRDEMQHVFGALSSCTLRVCDSYDGNGTSFLYSFHRSHECTVFPWTGDNSFFFKGDMDSLSFGGGRGKFGLWLDGDFYHGASHPCPTFNNEVLSHKTDFICAGIEAWHFG